MSDIALSASIRNNLLSLQGTTKLMDRTSGRLSTGKKVQSATDDAVAFFQAKGLTDRANDLGERKDLMNQGIQSINTGIQGLNAVESILRQMKGNVASAKSSTADKRAELMKTFNSLAVQLNKLVGDATYQGLNLIGGTNANLRVQFSDKDTAFMQVDGVDVHASALMTAGGMASVQGSALAGASWSAISAAVTRLRAIEATLDTAISKVQGIAERLGGNVAMMQTRVDFTSNYNNVLKSGSDLLTSADTSEESVNMVALNTRQQLGIQALSSSNHAQQSVLSLFR